MWVLYKIVSITDNCFKLLAFANNKVEVFNPVLRLPINLAAFAIAISLFIAIVPLILYLENLQRQENEEETIIVWLDNDPGIDTEEVNWKDEGF